MTLLDSPEMLRWDREVSAIRGASLDMKRGSSGSRLRRSLRGAHLECEICQSTRSVDWHHESYLRPHDLIALCRHHHLKRHQRLREQGRDPRAVYFAHRRSGGPPHELARRITPVEVRS